MPADLSCKIVQAADITRSHHGELFNPLGGTPRIVFDWQRVTILPGGEVLSKEVGRTEMTAENHASEFPLVDPETLRPTGRVITVGEAYAVFVSCAVHSANVAAAAGALPAEA